MLKKQAFATLLLAAGTFGAASIQAAPAGADAVSKGRQQYEVSCMHCHGANADGKGAVIDFLKIAPADLTALAKNGAGVCVAERVLKAVLGRHAVGDAKANMPLLKDALTPEEIYFVSEYVKSIQR